MDFEYELLELKDDFKIAVTNDHTFGTDALILADFASPRHKDVVCDLGTGCGIIPFVLENRFSPKHIFGVEIQEKGIEQMNFSVKINKLEDKITPVLGDIKDLSDKLKENSCDVVTCNPPYKIMENGIRNEKQSHYIARHEVLCNIDDVCKSAFYLLKQGGKLCICQRPERLIDVIEAMKKNRIEPKTLKLVSKKADTQPWLFVIEGKKLAKPNLKILPSLVVYENGEYTEDMKKIYGK